MNAPRLSTARLHLWLPDPSWAEPVADYFRRNREHFRPWDPPRSPAFFTIPYWQTQLEANRRELEEDRSLRLFLELQGQMVGHCNFTGITRGPFQACYLGYGLAADQVGRGLMTEALRAALTYVFEELKLHRVMANYLPENERSRRVLERLGFRVEGYAPEYLYINGAWRDHVLTALTTRAAPPPG